MPGMERVPGDQLTYKMRRINGFVKVGDVDGGHPDKQNTKVSGLERHRSCSLLPRRGREDADFGGTGPDQILFRCRIYKKAVEGTRLLAG